MDPLAADDPEQIDGYRLLSRLGAGGMGVVFHATAPDGTPVAVKVIRAEYADDPDFRRRFAAEVAACRRVAGQCTARVLAADAAHRRPYLVTEFVAGPNLAEQVTIQGPLPAGPLRALAIGLAEALTAIHAAGLVHRDLKPSNVLLSPTGPKVIDFGIAAAADASAVTRSGVHLGSPGWMAPEEASSGGGRDPAIDVFAWGLVVAYAATGRPPFGQGRYDAVVYRIVHAEPDLAGFEPPLDTHVRQALAKDPAERPTAPRLLADLLGEPTLDPARPVTTVLARAVSTVLARDWTLTLTQPGADPVGESGQVADVSSRSPMPKRVSIFRRRRPRR